jgi:hypothetical protein
MVVRIGFFVLRVLLFDQCENSYPGFGFALSQTTAFFSYVNLPSPGSETRPPGVEETIKVTRAGGGGSLASK